MAPAPDPLAGLMAYAGPQDGPARPLPPVELWNPAHCGAIDIRIARDGSWLHEGRPITRPALVRLFSSVLRRDGEAYVLVTPAEKLTIQVEDVPFVAVRLDRTPEGLLFSTNVGDAVLAGPDHGLWVESRGGGEAPRPYLHVRGGLEARLSRPVFYELAEMAEPREGMLAVRSGGVWFPLGPA